MKTKLKAILLLCIVTTTVAQVCEEILMPDGRIRTNCSYTKPIPMDGKITAPSTNPAQNQNQQHQQVLQIHIPMLSPVGVQPPPSAMQPQAQLQTQENLPGGAYGQQKPTGKPSKPTTTTQAPITQQDVAQVMDLIEDILDTVKALQQVVNMRKKWPIGGMEENANDDDISDPDLSISEEEQADTQAPQPPAYPHDNKPPYIIQTPEQPHGITPIVVHLPAVVQTANDFQVAQDILAQNLNGANAGVKNESTDGEGDKIASHLAEHQEAAERMQRTLDDMQQMINAAAQDIPLPVQKEPKPVQAKMLAESVAYEEEPEPQTAMLPAGVKTTPKPRPPHKH